MGKSSVFSSSALAVSLRTHSQARSAALAAIANVQSSFYCQRSAPIAAGYSVSNTFRTQVSRPRRSPQFFLAAQHPSNEFANALAGTQCRPSGYRKCSV